MEGPVAVIDPGIDKIGQHPVAIGSTDEFFDRNSHFFSVDRRQNVAEIAGRNRHIELLLRLQ